jgi:FKBP-type peptidyl-prolyl cis-trans isomerase FklB
MKKLLMLALVVLTSASFCLAETGKKDKKKKNAVAQMPVALTSKTDSMSFAMGMEATNGLIPYLTGQLGVDTTYMSKFIEGFSDAIDSLKNNKEIVAYGAGVNIAQMVSKNMIGQASKSVAGIIDEVDGDMFKQGFLSALRKDYAHFNDSTAAAFVAGKHDEYTKAIRLKGEQFLAEKAKESGVVTLPSGLQYKVLREGNGPIATKDDEVEVKYEGRLIDGTVFDSSYERNPQTTKFRPTQVIKGWTEALTMMPEGSMWELYIPQTLGYGERQAGKIPPFSTLIFKVELVKVTTKE